MKNVKAIEDIKQAESFINSAQLMIKQSRSLIHAKAEKLQEALDYAMSCLEEVRKNPKKVDNFKVVWTIDKIKSILDVDQPEEVD